MKKRFNPHKVFFSNRSTMEELSEEEQLSLTGGEGEVDPDDPGWEQEWNVLEGYMSQEGEDGGGGGEDEDEGEDEGDGSGEDGDGFEDGEDIIIIGEDIEEIFIPPHEDEDEGDGEDEDWNDDWSEEEDTWGSEEDGEGEDDGDYEDGDEDWYDGGGDPLAQPGSWTVLNGQFLWTVDGDAEPSVTVTPDRSANVNATVTGLVSKQRQCT